MYDMNPITLSFPADEEHKFLEYYFQRSIKYVRVSLLLGLGLYALFGVLDGLLNQETRPQLWLIVYGVICPAIIAVLGLTFSRHFERFMQEAVSIVMLLGGLVVILITALASPPGNYSYYAGLILILMYSYTFIRLRFIYATIVTWITIAVYEVVAIAIIKTPLPILLVNNYYFLSANLIGMISGYRIERYIRRDFKQRQQLEIEKEKSEHLLLNILPKSIADEIMTNPREVIVDRFQDVTILFADLVGFTDLSSRIPPRALVEYLNEIFSVLDDLVERYGLEKIKTIGDGYMAAGGLPVSQPDHAHIVAEMALDTQEEIAKSELAKVGNLALRIGIHSGPVVAGVIGRKKFSYDVWGSTVNIASRMEYHSAGGKILVSEETYSKIRDDYAFEEREIIDVKGRGGMKTYFLVGRNIKR